MKRLDKLSSIFWLLIGLYGCVHAYKLGLGKLREPGPGLIFFLSGGFLSILSLINILETSFMTEEENKISRQLWSDLKWEKNIIVIAGLIACIYSFEFLGFFVSTFLLLLLLFRIIEPMAWWIAILVAILTTSLVYVVFGLWMNVPFPRGLIGI